MIQAWRIVHQDFLFSAFDGEGARIAGGRWNSEGLPVVYTAGSLSLALLEIIVHLEVKEALKYFKVIPVSFSEQLVRHISSEELPMLWNSTPPSFVSKSMGDQWLQSKDSATLCVPSAVVPNETNYLLNPQHPDIEKIKIGETLNLPVDPRVLEKLR